MERLIASLTSLDEVQTEFEVKLCEIPEYTGGLDASLQFTIPAGSYGKRISFDIADNGEAIDLAFNACSLRLPVVQLQKEKQARYAIDIDGELLEVPIADFDTVIIPYRPFDHFDIVILSDFADTLIVNNIRAVTDELPQDILRGFLKMELPRYPIGEISVTKGQRKIRLPDITNIVDGTVIGIGSHRHQIKGLVGDLATLEDTEDGGQILGDFDGMCYIETPIRIGFYDQDIKLPSVVLWFTSPTPDLRAIRREEYRIFGEQAYIKTRTQFEEWTVRLEVVGGSPEMTQAVATYVRRFLEENRIWINGKRFTFEWTDSAIDTEPSSYLDIQPSVAYNIKLSLQEDFLWQTITKGSGRLRNVVPMPKI